MDRYLRKLIRKGSSYIGMVEETKMKCALIKMRIKKAEENGTPFEEFEPQVRDQINQIRIDLDTYMRKLEKVEEEINRYVNSYELE